MLQQVTNLVANMLALFLTTGVLIASASASCDRSFLVDLTSAYLGAQGKGTYSSIQILAPNITYTEQFKPIPLSSSIFTGGPEYLQLPRLHRPRALHILHPVHRSRLVASVRHRRAHRSQRRECHQD